MGILVGAAGQGGRQLAKAQGHKKGSDKTKIEGHAMTSSSNVRGMIAVDKIGCKILFLNPQTYETETVLDGFQRTVHELLVMPDAGLAYVPIFGDGIHGRNPNPGHVLHVIDLIKRKVVGTIGLSPLSAPHTVRLGADG